jgi:murein DD-endopeptidase MepM/ murein hydrolase activator NlpD
VPVCYNRPNPCTANNLLKNKTFILAQTHLAQFLDAARRRRQRLAWAGLAVLFAGAAIVIAAQMHPDAVAQVVRQELAVPAVLSAVSGATDDSEFWREEKIVRGDTVGDVLARLGVRDEDLNLFIHADPGARALYRLLPGKSVRVRIDEDGDLLALRYLTREGDLLEIDQSHDGEYHAQSVPPPFATRVQLRSGEIRTSLFGAADAAGMPDAVTIQLAEIFSGDIDFFHDLRSGDSFTVAYEMLELDGEQIRVGRVLAAEFVNKGVAFRAFLFGGTQESAPAGGYLGYYADDGKNLRKAFLRSPMEFSRITSRFSLSRFHPILQAWRAHKGTDFGAPTGTPVRATGDGTVDFAGRQGGYGNFVLLRHQGAFSTGYGHLSRFGAGLRKGARVLQGQVIGYVGQTGWATGPHLHYEFRINAVQRNPLSVALPTALPIPADKIAAFRARSEPLSVQLALARGLLFAAAD